MKGLFDRFSKERAKPEATVAGPAVVQIDTASLSRVFSAPTWVRDLGLLAWFLVGVGVLLVGVVVLLGIMSTILIPVTLGAILATVFGPLVSKLQRHMPRAAGAGIVLLGLLAIAVVIALLVFGGIYEQSAEIKSSLSAAVDKIEGWANDAGAGGTSDATASAKSGTAETGKTLFAGRRERHRRPDLARLLHHLQRLRDVLPAQGRADRAPLRGSAPGRAA